MRKFQRHRRSLTWIASLSAAAVVATIGATAVLADAPAGCTAPDGSIVTDEQYAANPSLCDEGGTEAAPVVEPTPAPEPAPEPEPEPTTPAPTDPTPQPDATTPQPDATTPQPDATTPQPDATTPQPDATTPQPDTTTPQPDATTPQPDATTPQPDATTPQPTTPAPTTPEPTQPAPPTAGEPTGEDPAPTTTREPAVPVRTQPRPAAPKPTAPADPVEEQRSQVLKVKRFQAAPFRDARLFREQFEPKGRIPAQPNMPAEDAQLLADAAAGTGTSWATLTAVAWLESRWNDPSAGGIVGRRLTAKAWAAHGTDGDGDGRVIRSSRADQAKTVAVFLAEARTRDRAALEAYFSGTKRAVMAERALFLADYFDALGKDALVDGLDDPEVRAKLEQRTLADDTIEVYDGGRSDIEAGLIDPRVLVTLRFLANRYDSVTVSSLISGHGVYTSGGNVSLHSYGQGVDIAALGGESILGNQQKDGRTYRAVQDVLLLPKAMQPSELITLWDMGGASFALADHHDHIHIGWKTEQGPALSGNGSDEHGH